MYETTRTSAEAVTRWPSLGVKLPKNLTDAIEVYETLLWIETGHVPVFDLSKVTPKNAEAKLREFASELASTLPTVPTPGGAPQSVLDTAKRVAVDHAARAVSSAAVEAVPEIIEALTPEFEKHAAAYADAVS